MKSTLYSLNWRDFVKGLILAGLVPALVIIQQSITNGDLTFNWKSITMAAIAGFVGYLLKNFFTNDVKAAQTTLVDAKAAEIKKTETDPAIAATKIQEVKNNIATVVNTPQ